MDIPLQKSIKTSYPNIANKQLKCIYEIKKCLIIQ